MYRVELKSKQVHKCTQLFSVTGSSVTGNELTESITFNISKFKFYLISYSIKFPTVPQHKMQHAVKEKFLFSEIPKLKRTQVPQREIALTN